MPCLLGVWWMRDQRKKRKEKRDTKKEVEEEEKGKEPAYCGPFAVDDWNVDRLSCTCISCQVSSMTVKRKEKGAWEERQKDLLHDGVQLRHLLREKNVLTQHIQGRHEARDHLRVGAATAPADRGGCSKRSPRAGSVELEHGERDAPSKKKGGGKRNRVGEGGKRT